VATTGSHFLILTKPNPKSMKKFLGLALAAIFFSACSTQKSESTTDSVAVTSINTLTEQEKTGGWKSLFDGQTMKGWTIFKGKENDTWEVVDGTLHCKAPGDSVATKRADLRTEEQFENFEFAFDWKIAPTHNSGVMFHVTEDFDVPYATGPEYQLIDDVNYPGGVQPKNQTASNYDMQVAENKKMNPPGEWNSSKILVNGPHVEHWLNGNKVLEYELWSDDWKKMVANSKWKEFPGYGLTKKGYLDLQDHGGEVWFRNLKVKTL
jgi:hypothetical protein